jgi:hypothetical protein
MSAFAKVAILGPVTALALIAGLALTAGANAQTLHQPVHKKIQAQAPRRLVERPFAPGVELRTSTSVSEGSENHYFSDTVASTHTDLMDHGYRYGQSPTPEYDEGEPLFRF